VRNSILLFLVFSWFGAQAQSPVTFNHATLYLEGLTCSLCSYSVQDQLMRLGIIQDIQMDLNTNQARLTFLPQAHVRWEQLRKAVDRAGFSLGRIELSLVVNQAGLSQFVLYKSQIKLPERPVGKEVCLVLLDMDCKSGVSKKERKEHPPLYDPSSSRLYSTGLCVD
jgi:hypothetical protein